MNRAKARVTTVLLARRARAFRRHLRGAAEGDGHGVHQARVASRRLREAVPVLAAGLKGSKAGKARKKIRRITRALGSIRELDVTLALVDELARRNTLPRLALEEVRRRVVQAQIERREVMMRKLERVNVDKLNRRLQSVGESLQSAASEEWRAALASRLLKRAKSLADAVEAGGQMYEAERLHRVRIAAKKLRYAVELAAESGTRSAAAAARVIKRGQDTLGHLHDLQVLQGYVAAAQADGALKTPPDGGLDIIARLLEEECRHLHARYVASVPALVQATTTIRTEVVPQLTRRTAKTRRPLKMTLGPGRQRPASSRPAVARAR